MHFVAKSPAPESLVAIAEREIPKWKTYFATTPRKGKPDSAWLAAEIRDVIESDFRKSCCYCGIGLGETLPTQGKAKKLGQVEHFFPKSARPDLVLDWENLLWCCGDCNFTKLEYYSPDPNQHLLHPCCQTDMDAVAYLPSSGEYGLGDGVAVEIASSLKARLDLTEEKTLLNAGGHPRRRKNIVDAVIDNFESVLRHQSRLANKGLPPELTDSFKRELESARDQFARWVNQPDYPHLVRYMLNHYAQKHPKQKQQLDELLEQVGFEA